MHRTRATIADPTIPRKLPPLGNAAQRTVVAGPTEGWLVDYGGGTVVLTDIRGNMWPAERVRFLCGLGTNDEGLVRPPRPRKYNPDGTVLIEGDTLFVEFIDADPSKPVVRGGVRTLKPTDPTFFAGQDVGQDPNPIRWRAALQDPKSGAVTGSVQLRALDGGSRFELVVGGSKFGTGLRLLLDYGAGTISFDRQGTTHPVPLGDEIVTRLQQIAQDLISINAALPTLSPVPTLNAFQLLIDAAQSLSAGAPLLSTTVRVQ
jgi:hypothetical protein